jgi:UDPglucose 6-dehydrogenase
VKVIHSVSVIGQGFVGGSLSKVLMEKGVAVCAYDIAGKYVSGVFQAHDFIRHNSCVDLEEAIDYLQTRDMKFSNIYFVCLPTPMNADGSADLSIIESTLKDLASSPRKKIVVIKSTVPPGSTERWNKEYKDSSIRIIFNPEFLREASALDDMRNQDRIVLGGPRPEINSVKRFYESVFPNVPIIKTSSTTAEMVKYVTNIHLAVKVSLANEFYQICEVLDKRGLNIDYDKVIEYATVDKRLGNSHWKVPGPMPADDTGDPAFGFGGSCVIGQSSVRLGSNRCISVEQMYEIHQFTNDMTLLSTDMTCNNLQVKSVLKSTRKKYSGNVIEFKIGDKTITTTPEHFFPVIREGKLLLLQACEIVNTDELFLLEEDKDEKNK